MKVNNRDKVFYQNKWRVLFYSHIDTPCWKVIVGNSSKKLNNTIGLKAYETSTFCIYKGWKYYLENIIYGKAILSPEPETKAHLGLHTYSDKRIEVDYNYFMQEVEEIWEERTPIKGFIFDVEPIYYIKRKGEQQNQTT